ncbi:hypothetical protein P1S61_37525 [Streptomyces sp. ME08-AFT2]|uniref:hypothetical protein n=1 Tax=Streptomyces sp. ME08-AFT2 TaxID=3028683 RepID=UPI0029A0E9A9|nr:hypothetical protein [Streptomyces sp. ME08-AFT2]MDX3314658.1 hypothetical protein [Streptomyces sp. ME08-AFT2]
MDAELDTVRATIRRLTIDTTRIAFQSWPWEAQHNTYNALTNYRAEEAKLIARIDAAEQRTATLVEAAEISGNPLLFAIAYIAVGVATEGA